MPTPPPAPPGPFLESGGLVVFEAERYSYAEQPGTQGANWEFDSEPLGYVGPGTMQSLPDSGIDHELTVDGPALVYSLRFETLGTYYVFGRGHAPSPHSDAVHAGVNGVPVTTSGSKGLSGWGTDYTWQMRDRSDQISITIPAAGDYEFWVWMKEDGVVLDRFLLSTDPDYYSKGDVSEGPPESPIGSP